MTGEDFWEGVEWIAGMRTAIPEERRSVKTIRVAIAGRALDWGRHCATLWLLSVDDAFAKRHKNWMFDSRRDGDHGPAIVEIELDTLEPTDDGDPDELRLCEQAQREERAK